MNAAKGKKDDIRNAFVKERFAIGVNRNDPGPTPKYDIKPNRAKAFVLDLLSSTTAILL